MKRPDTANFIGATVFGAVIIGVTALTAGHAYDLKSGKGEPIEMRGVVSSLAPAHQPARIGSAGYAAIHVQQGKQPASPGDTIIVRMDDPKAVALQPGDQVRLLCNLTFVPDNAGDGGIWEYTGCALDSEIERPN